MEGEGSGVAEHGFDPGGSNLVHTERGAFLDGVDRPAEREIGCRALFEALGRELARQG